MTPSEQVTLPVTPHIICYTVVTGEYDSIASFAPEPDVDYLLFTDQAVATLPQPWKLIPLAPSTELSVRRLSRLPKLMPHLYLPPHDISIYIDGNITLQQPIRDLAVAAMRQKSIAIPPHPSTDCLYEEAIKCIQLGLDEASTITRQTSIYRARGFPSHYGLTENCLIVRRNTLEIQALNMKWWSEYSSGSQRDQLCLTFCLWELGIGLHLLRHNPRANAYYEQRRHVQNRSKQATLLYRLRSAHELALFDIIGRLPERSRMLEVRPGLGVSTEVFIKSGRFREIICVGGSETHASEGVFDIPQLSSSNVSNYVSEDPKSLSIANQSIDLVYLSNSNSLEATSSDIRMWRPKVKPGGYLAGSNFRFSAPDVRQAVITECGRPDLLYSDGTWLIKSDNKAFTIVSYCNIGYIDALEFVIDSWLQNAEATQVIIYTDSAELEARVKPRNKLSFRLAFSLGTGTPQESWQRKIEAIRLFSDTTSHPYFVYLDCDCWVRSSFKEVFLELANADVAGTRLLGRSDAGRGHANAGVIFFKYGPSLNQFFSLWKSKMAFYEAQGIVRLCEQTALSDLLVEGFDGLHCFRATLISEHIYNSENNSEALWLAQIKQYQPKILHFKMQRFRSIELREAAFSQLECAIQDGPFLVNHNGRDKAECLSLDIK